MSKSVAVIGAGVGGLAAAIRLALQGYDVTLLEARVRVGGLASALEAGAKTFDGGPYILLDRPGLEWAFGELGLDLDRELALMRIDPVYEVRFPEGRVIRFHADIGRTAEEMDRAWPGHGARFHDFVEKLERIHRDTLPLLFLSRPKARHLLRHGIFRHAMFLLRDLETVLRRTRLSGEIQNALAIWTHIAGRDPREAPSLLALVPALIHSPGAYYPKGGMSTIGERLLRRASAVGVDVRTSSPVQKLHFGRGLRPRVQVEGESMPFDAVVSNAGGLGTYLGLVADLPIRERRNMEGLPLQSPGICIYLEVKSKPEPPYLRFFLYPDSGGCRLFVRPGAVGGDTRIARLIAPAEPEDEERTLARVLREDWWKPLAGECEILATRTPTRWGREFRLYRNAMNPVMTRSLLRAGRLPHRSPYFPRLYLAGSATHPGQWVSFSIISGILAADALNQDLG
ncbi:MAG TPA: NAD(P)/FAD-dependent oxidoreductase [Vicinamibacteria bacterium]|nr:NAD(P)/FAD-dependent oxidoreductase [Vicinamibacteria bacterium]